MIYKRCLHYKNIINFAKNISMKKIILVVFVLTFFNGCDDGDFVVKNFNFNNAPVEKCNNLLYIKRGSELMILNIPATNFTETPTNGTPRIYTLANANELIYRNYTGTVTSDVICNTIPPSNPTVVEEYNAISGGKVEVNTVVTATVSDNSNATTITYSHQIKLKEIQFSNENNTLNYNEFIFGNYQSRSSLLSFNFDTSLGNACNSNKIYKNTATQAMILSFNSFNFPMNVGTTTVNLDADNSIVYRLYAGGSLSPNEICSNTTPTLPLYILEEWTANEGTVTIITEEIVNGSNVVTGYKHTITMQNVVYKKDNLSFTHTTYVFGEYIYNL